MIERLISWTRTLNEDDALLLLDEAQPGLSLEQWTDRGHDILPQPSRDRRTELIRLVREKLLDWTPQGTVADTRWLGILRASAPGPRRHLLHGRFLFDAPWILRVQATLIGPHLEAAEAPLAERDADLIKHATWVSFVEENALPNTGPESLKKTRSVVLRNLARLDVISPEGERGEDARVRRGKPDPLAFGWLLAFELRTKGVGECSLGWAAHHSRPATLFRPEPAYAERCVNAALAAGLLRRSFIAGEARYLDGGE